MTNYINKLKGTISRLKTERDKAPDYKYAELTADIELIEAELALAISDMEGAKSMTKTLLFKKDGQNYDLQALEILGNCEKIEHSTHYEYKALTEVVSVEPVQEVVSVKVESVEPVSVKAEQKEADKPLEETAQAGVTDNHSELIAELEAAINIKGINDDLKLMLESAKEDLIKGERQPYNGEYMVGNLGYSRVACKHLLDDVETKLSDKFVVAEKKFSNSSRSKVYILNLRA